MCVELSVGDSVQCTKDPGKPHSQAFTMDTPTGTIYRMQEGLRGPHKTTETETLQDRDSWMQITETETLLGCRNITNLAAQTSTDHCGKPLILYLL